MMWRWSMLGAWRVLVCALIAVPACSDSDAGTDAQAADATAAAGGSAAGSAGRSASGGGGAGTAGSAAGQSSAGAAAGTSGGSANDAGGPRDASAADGGAIVDAATTADAGAMTDSGSSACKVCSAYGEPAMLASVKVAQLDALSGIAVSARNPDVLFAHNDRTSSEVFALGFDGALRARFTLTGVTTVDLEDIAVGTCPSGSCLFIADIGGNIAPRSEYAILRAPEPLVAAGSAAGAQALAVERFAFAYEDGAHNAEGILIDPSSGALYVVTKLGNGQASSVYALPNPLSAASGNTARKVADLPVPRAGDSPATSTSAQPCGAGFLLRTNQQLYEFRITPGAAFETAFAAQPVAISAGSEPQSEAVSYLPDGSGFITSGETAGAPIYRSLCK